MSTKPSAEHVGEDAAVFHQQQSLEDAADSGAAVLRRDESSATFAEPDLAFARGECSREAGEQGGLTSSRGTDHRDEGAARDREIQIAEEPALGTADTEAGDEDVSIAVRSCRARDRGCCRGGRAGG
jgi:hypothetical protein